MFDGARELDITQYAATATLGRSWASRWSVRGSLGAVLGGALVEGGQRYELGAGLLAAASVARQWAWGPWFAIGTLGVAASRTTTTARDGVVPGVDGERRPLYGLDLARAGAMAGRRFGPVSPYVLARVFGGPVLWTIDGQRATGTDAYHVQLGAGASVSTAGGATLLLDVSALGERSASLAVALRL